MNWNEWKSIKVWDTIYNTKTKRPRKIIKWNEKTNTATLENWVVYCLGDKYLFDKHKWKQKLSEKIIRLFTT